MKPLEEPSLVQGDFWRLGLEGRQLPLGTPPIKAVGHASGYKQLAAGRLKGPTSVSREVTELRLHRIPHLHRSFLKPALNFVGFYYYYCY